MQSQGHNLSRVCSYSAIYNIECRQDFSSNNDQHPNSSSSHSVDSPAYLPHVLPLIEADEFQYKAYNDIVNSVKNNIPEHLFFLSGPGGSGKTFVYNAITSNLLSSNKRVLCVASTGIAASLLFHGRTAHSVFKIPISKDYNILFQLPALSEKERDRLSSFDLLIWDEISMQKKSDIFFVDRLLQNITNADKPFGGKYVLFGGDFAQTVPISGYGGLRDVTESIKSDLYWSKIHRSWLLVNNYRILENEENREFKVWVSNLRSHNCSIDIPSYINRVSNVTDLMKQIYDLNNLTFFHPPSTTGQHLLESDIRNLYNYFHDRAILCPDNQSVDEKNRHLLVSFSQSWNTPLIIKRGREAVVSLDRKCRHLEATDVVPSITGCPLTGLEICLGAPVMILRNFYTPCGFYPNGARFIVSAISQDLIKISRIHNGEVEHVELPRSKFQHKMPMSNSQYVLMQFPIRLAFSMTIHKSQGQSINRVGLDFSKKQSWAHGMTYVAFSRAKDVNNLFLLCPTPTLKTIQLPTLMLERNSN